MFAFFLRNLKHPPVVLVLSVIAMLAALYLFRIDALFWYYWHNNKQQAQTKHSALKLNDYRVEIDGQGAEHIAAGEFVTIRFLCHDMHSLSEARPRLIQALTVPSGDCRRWAISPCVQPST